MERPEYRIQVPRVSVRPDVPCRSFAADDDDPAAERVDDHGAGHPQWRTGHTLSGGHNSGRFLRPRSGCPREYDIDTRVPLDRFHVESLFPRYVAARFG